MKRVLVIAAHPDDEVLGCGATMALHAASGDDVSVVLVAEGITSRSDVRDPSAVSTELEQLKDSARKANKLLGVHSVSFLAFPDNRLDSVDLLDLIKAVEEHIGRFHPSTVYTHHGGDLNVDHRCVHQAVMTACRPLQKSSVEEIFLFEVPSSTEWQLPGHGQPFVPNYFVDVKETLEAKCIALEAYSSEMRPWPHPRSLDSVRHLAGWRGSNVSLEAAEAFMLGRAIRRLPR